MDFTITNRLKLIADRLEEKIDQSVSDLQSGLADIERELSENRDLSESILARIDAILDRLKHPYRHQDDDKRCHYGEPSCACGEH